ncbi:MAG: DUF4491 family protein [Bacteroidaceae bacterium]|nr:DUF4491 family protein [Bacteroidaceae bacterium]
MAIYTEGLLIGLTTFIIIGCFHPIVIKAEYYFGTRIWWVFLVAGIGFITGALFTGNVCFSSILGILGFSCFWSILEIFAQKKRVQKGWFPMNPKRKKYYEE